MEYFVVLAFQKWSGLNYENEGKPIRLKFNDKLFGEGFLVVFSSREEAERHYPKHRVMKVKLAGSPYAPNTTLH